jgi:hypothetical protein
VSGFRLHFSSLVKEGKITSAVSDKAQLSLGHSYSRAKVKFNVHRVDNMIIQSIALLDQLDKDINTFSMRIRLVHCKLHAQPIFKIKVKKLGDLYSVYPALPGGSRR